MKGNHRFSGLFTGLTAVVVSFVLNAHGGGVSNPAGGVPSVNGYTGPVTGAQAVAGAAIAPTSVTITDGQKVGGGSGYITLGDGYGSHSVQVMGAVRFQETPFRLTVAGNGVVQWSSDDYFSPSDVGISRTASGVLAIGNGMAGDASGTLKLANLAASGAITIASGVNAHSGTFTLASGAATVANTSVTANSVFQITVKSGGVSGTRAGNPDIVPTAGTGFTATGASTDNSTYNYVIIEHN